jgi:hypothetical protein
VVDALRRDVQRQLQEEIGHLFEVLGAHALGLDPEKVLLMLGGTTTTRSRPAMCIAKAASVTLASIEQGERQRARRARAARAGDVGAQPVELHPASSRR